ncbi:MAG: tRNA (adenosine(37)-N6)-threonylcarbamoyltransferase complex dimerization subunit type 1 TsaB [Pseudomonadota bacterium]
MKILAFDTSTEYCTAALLIDGAVQVREVHAGQTHSQLLLPMCQDLLAEAGFTLNQLDGIAFGAGPGSFTGLRIACAVAQGLALGADVPVYGVSSLLALAEASAAPRVIACLDARMGEVYHAVYERVAGDWHEVSAPLLSAPEQVPSVPGSGWCGSGSGFRVYAAVMQARYEPALSQLRADLYPHAREIAVLAAPRFAAGEGMVAELAAPLYVRDKVALKTCER